MSAASSDASGRARALLPVLAAFAAASLSIATIAALRWWPREPASPPAIRIEIGGRAMQFDQRMLRSEQRFGGRLERADLLIDWSDFGPARLIGRDERGRPAPPAPDSHLLIALQPAEGAADPAERTLNVHGRFLEREIWTNPGGLILRRFRAGSPYEGEELVMTSDGREFAARCPIAGAQPSPLPQRCLASFRLAGVDATVSFDSSLLPHWRRMREGVLGLIGRALR
jgi:hypothetical protein